MVVISASGFRLKMCSVSVFMYVIFVYVSSVFSTIDKPLKTTVMLFFVWIFASFYDMYYEILD